MPTRSAAAGPPVWRGPAGELRSPAAAQLRRWSHALTLTNVIRDTFVSRPQ